jgi:hypothetical protein
MFVKGTSDTIQASNSLKIGMNSNFGNFSTLFQFLAGSQLFKYPPKWLRIVLWMCYNHVSPKMPLLKPKLHIVQVYYLYYGLSGVVVKCVDSNEFI